MAKTQLTDAEIKYAIKLVWERRYEEGCEKLGLPIRPLSIKFTIKGRKAGTASRVGGELSFNMDIARNNFASFLQRTPIHEVAHVITNQKYGSRAQSHGKEWKYIMSKVFDKNPTRCHNYDMTNVPVRGGKTYPYKCSCQTWMLSSIRHNRNEQSKPIRGNIYACPLCKGKLNYSP